MVVLKWQEWPRRSAMRGDTRYDDDDDDDDEDDARA